MGFSFVYFLWFVSYRSSSLLQEKISVGIYQEDTSVAATPAQIEPMLRLVDIVKGSGSEATVSANIAADKFHKNMW
jgi:hypothetical protein